MDELHRVGRERQAVGGREQVASRPQLEREVRLRETGMEVEAGASLLDLADP
jgi:hypothetical protein